MKRILTFIILVLVHLSSAAAYENYQGTWWVNGGVGLGDIFGDSDPQPGIALTASANYATRSNQLATLRTSGVNGNTFNLSQDKGDPKRATDVGVLYGVMNKSKYLLASITAGLAYTEITRVDEDSVSTVGFPLDAQLIWTPSPYVGLGLVGVVNANTEATFGAVLLTLQFGALS